MYVYFFIIRDSSKLGRVNTVFEDKLKDRLEKLYINYGKDVEVRRMLAFGRAFLS